MCQGSGTTWNVKRVQRLRFRRRIRAGCYKMASFKYQPDNHWETGRGFPEPGDRAASEEKGHL